MSLAVAALCLIETLRSGLDSFSLILSRGHFRENAFSMLATLALALAVFIFKFDAWCLVLMLGLLVFVFGFLVMWLGKLIGKPAVTLPDVTVPDVPDAESESRTYSWRFNPYGIPTGQTRVSSGEASISLSLCRECRGKKSATITRDDNWGDYPTKITPDFKMLAEALRDRGNHCGFLRIEETTNVLSME